MDEEISFAQFGKWADEILEKVPEAIMRDLNGGVQLAREARRELNDPPGVYYLGEYIADPYLGHMVIIYYGSFRKVLAGEGPEVWREELEKTIWHELRHHVETLAGVDDLVEEDVKELFRMRAEADEK
ncbi:MAG: metallopeptidase family protein [Bacillota bacterium]|nr:metallopeptidase family protein [Bacillota bacterium]